MCTSQLCSSGAFAGFQSPNIPGGIPLLQYADDTTFFIQGSWAAAHTLFILMDILSDFSGLQLNRAKSSFIGFGLSSKELVGCARILATPIGALPIRYLGMPLVDRRLRMRDWQPVLEKVDTRLGGWKARFLSRGGGGALYCLRRYYRLSRPTSWPYSGCQRGSVSGWSRSCGVSFSAALDKKTAWETVCQPVSQGGLGVPHLQQANMALLTKWVARLMHPSGEMVVAIHRDEYGASLDWQIWQTPQRGDSTFMSSLRTIFKTVQLFFRPKLGTGESFRFWADEWSGNGRLSQSFPRLFALALDPEGSVRQAWQNA